MNPKLSIIQTGWPSQTQGRAYDTLLLAVLLIGLLICGNPAFAAVGKLSNLTVANLSPAFNPETHQYTVPQPANCSLSVNAVLAESTANTKLYINSNLTSSGSTVNAWVCDGHPTAEIVIYENWTEVGRYTITPVAQAAPPPPPPVSGKLSSLSVANLSPAFDPNITQYTVPQPGNCAVAVTAVAQSAGNANLKLYVANTLTSSGSTVNAWVCDGHTQIDIVLYDVWTEVGHYTITPMPASGATEPPNTGGTDMSGSGSSSGSGSTSGSTPIADPAPEPVPNPVIVPLPLPSPAPITQAEAARFLDQASFGPTAAEVAAVQQTGRLYWMAQQHNLPESALPDGLDINQVTRNVFLNMANAPDQLRQRMIFALSQIFVVSANKNINGEELIPWYRLLSRNAFGNFKTLLKEATLSPTMGKYLDLANSMKATASTAPNENYPREVMQLFTIGLKELNQDGSPKLDAQGQPIPTYNQTTLREVSRALTGLTYPTQPGAAPVSNNWEYFTGFMEYRQQNHDSGAKTLLNGLVLPAGQTVKQDIDAVLDMLFQHPNTAPFIATRLIRLLTLSNPSPAYIQRVADVFVDNGQGARGDLWAVLTAVLNDPEATAPPTSQSGRMKDPTLHILGLGRALGAQIVDPSQFMYLFRNLGEQVLAPPTVFSFFSPLAPLPGYPGLYGPEFQIYSPGLAIQRGNFIYQILNGEFGSSFSLSLAQFVAVAGDPAALVEKVNQVLLFGRMSDGLRQILLTAAQATPDAGQRALGAVYLAALSDEYSVQP
jgi:uncharacterized protein (DUF1800 family)